MVDAKDLQILSLLRQDARMPLSLISKRTSIPLSTVFDRLRRLEKSVITKHISLIDFQRIGLHLRAHLIIHTEEGPHLERFIMDARQTNSAYRTHTGYLVEGVFSSMLDFHSFVKGLKENGASFVEEHHVLEDMKREGFNVINP